MCEGRVSESTCKRENYTRRIVSNSFIAESLVRHVLVDIRKRISMHDRIIRIILALCICCFVLFIVIDLLLRCDTFTANRLLELYVACRKNKAQIADTRLFFVGYVIDHVQKCALLLPARCLLYFSSSPCFRDVND